MNLTFYGAAKTVTGSCTMVEVAGNKFLIDCGMFQGKMTDQMLNYDDFPFDVNDIDFMILTHAHIDHSGRIPKLYKAGYTNPIYATNATVDLCGIMLADSGHIQEKEIEWVNKKRRRAGKKENEPMYTAQDGIDSLKLFKGVNYNKKITINENISFTLVDAGHMLGSSIVLLDLTENGQTKRVVFTGDLGNKNMPIIKDPTYIEGADHLIMESTYGNRLHGKMEDQSDKFIDILLRTIERGGNLIIPSFAVGRTQEILYEINKYAAKEGYAEKLKNIPVYVDSPLAVNATKIFEENPEYYDEEAVNYLMKGDNPIDFGTPNQIYYLLTGKKCAQIDFNDTKNCGVAKDLDIFKMYSKKHFDKFMKDFSKTPENYAAGCNLRIKEQMPFRNKHHQKIKLMPEHSYAIKKINDKYVTIIDPQKSRIPIEVPVDMFKSIVGSVYYFNNNENEEEKPLHALADMSSLNDRCMND